MNRLLTLIFAVAVLAFTSSCEQNNRIKGCSDPYAINFDPTVLVSDDDGSCAFPPNENKGLLIDITATWCGPCGDWGVPLFGAVNEASEGLLLAMAIHPDMGDIMYNAEAEAIATGYPDFTGYPTILTQYSQPISPPNETTAEVIKNQMLAFRSEPTQASAIALWEVNGDQIEVIAQARFFEEVSGEYHMAVYLMENGIDEYQNGITDSTYIPYLHDHVLRGSANGEGFGETVLNGTSWTGQTETRSYTRDIDPSWNLANMYIATVIWKYNGTGFDFVNAYQEGVLNLPQ